MMPSSEKMKMIFVSGVSGSSETRALSLTQ